MSYTLRTADYVIQKAWSEAKGKSTPPSTGTTKYSQLLTLVDTELKNLQDEEGIEWDWLYTTVTLSSGVSPTDTFALDNAINYISKKEDDFIYLLSPDGTQKKPITLVRPNQLYAYYDQPFCAAQEGRNLVFSQAFTSDSSYIGYSINVPSYTFVNDIATGTDIVNCPDPLYIAYMVAASYARNDLIKVGQYDNILNKATVRLNRMKQNNSGQLEEVPIDTVGVQLGESW